MTTWLLALLASAHLRLYSVGYSTLIVLSVGLFALVDLAPLPVSDHLRAMARRFCLVLVLCLVVIGPTAQLIVARLTDNSSAYVHDGAIQTEEAIKLLLAGQNPYGADYTKTALAQWAYWPYSGQDSMSNPALFHLTYLPGTFVPVVPFYLLSKAFLGWFDLRLVLVCVYLATWFLLPRLTLDENRLPSQIAFALNPLLTIFVVEGRNDIEVLFWVVLSLVFLRRNRISWGALAFGMACATKQTVWFMVPCFLAFFYFGPLKRQWRSLVVRVLIPLGIPLALVSLPFIVWNVTAYVNDVLIFQLAIFHAAGYGVSQLLLLTGILPSDTAPFPFIILQIVFGVPTLLVLWRYQRTYPYLRVMLAAGTILTFVFAFFNRSFQDNYIGYIIALGSIAYLMPNEVMNA